MSLRELPDFLTRGDAELVPLMPGLRDGTARMRAMMGMGRTDPLGQMILEEARAWLRHVEAGRIGGVRALSQGCDRDAGFKRMAKVALEASGIYHQLIRRNLAIASSCE